MGVSLYYSYEREATFSDEERTAIDLIIGSYNDSYPFKEKAEPFSFYSSDATKMELEGATKLPLTENIEDTIMALYHWLNCLTEIRRKTKDGKWRVQLDETEVLWDDLDGWVMPG